MASRSALDLRPVGAGQQAALLGQCRAQVGAHCHWVFLSWNGQSPPAGRNSTLLENRRVEWKLTCNLLSASEFPECLYSVVTQRHWPHCLWGEFGQSQGVSTTVHPRTQNLEIPKGKNFILKIPKIAQLDFHYKLSNNFWINDTNWSKSI